MKKILTVLLLSVFVFVLFSCGEKTDYSKYAGSYQDNTSQRASAEMTDNGDSLKIVIEWSNSVFEADRWTMTAKLKDNKFSYSDCKKESVTYSENGDESITLDYENGKGYFELDYGKFYWTGAEEELCRTCEFINPDKIEISDPIVESPLVGAYNDSFSQRAYMTLNQPEEGVFKIQVDWSGSYNSHTQWMLTAESDGDRLVYSDCMKLIISTDEDGIVSCETVYENGEGYFEVDKNGNILWSGSSEDDCRDCKFEKAKEVTE